MGEWKGAEEGPRVVLIGMTDLAGYGIALSALVTERELSRRIPDLSIRRMSPLGWQRRVTIAAGRGSEPLGARTDARRDEIAALADAVVIGPVSLGQGEDSAIAASYGEDAAAVMATSPSAWFVDALGDTQPPVPTAWNAITAPSPFTPETAARVRNSLGRLAYVSVCGSASRENLQAARVEREVHAVPEPALLTARLFGDPALRRRLAFQRTMGWVPPGPFITLVLDGHPIPDPPSLVRTLTDVLERHPEHALVIVDGGSLTDLVRAIEDRHPARVYRASAQLTLEDTAAVMREADLVLAGSAPVAAAAASFGRRCVDVAGLHGTAPAALGSPAPDPLIAGWCVELDSHFDALAAMISAARPGPRPSDEAAGAPVTAAFAAAQGVLDARTRQLARTRAVLGNALDKATAEAATAAEEGDRAREQLAGTQRHADHLQAELDAVHATKVFRVTKSMRAVYGRWRRT